MLWIQTTEMTQQCTAHKPYYIEYCNNNNTPTHCTNTHVAFVHVLNKNKIIPIVTLHSVYILYIKQTYYDKIIIQENLVRVHQYQ